MELQRRKNIRLRQFDYASSGAYFVTICSFDRRNTLSTIRKGDPCGRPQVQLYQLGRIAAEAFSMVEKTYDVMFDLYVIMPNHIHFIVFLPEHQPGSTPVTLGRVVGAYKSIVSREWLNVCKSRGQNMGKVWQRNYYEHVIRNERDLQDIRAYIDGNPDSWVEDRVYVCE